MSKSNCATLVIKPRFLSGLNTFRISDTTFLTAALAFLFSFASAQTSNTPPSITWQKAFGGSGDEVANSVKPTSDGGYIIAGQSDSNDGNISGNHGQDDFCLIKLNATGDLMWQHSYGGSGLDQAVGAVQTADGGFVVGGKSESKKGDVTGNHGMADYWVVKTDAQGILQWQKSYGGSQTDLANSFIATSDSGFAIAGTSLSNDGDISGNHAMGDAVVMKLDQNGNLQWEKTVGGSKLELISDIKQTRDGGYFVSGYSLSNNGDVAINKGQEDFFFFKLSANGNLEWEKTMGGSGGDCGNAGTQTLDGGYLIIGLTHSHDFDVVGSINVHDVWIVKTDSLGTAQWTRCLGGTALDNGVDIKQQTDGTIIATAYTVSNDHDVTNNHGGRDIWVFALDTAGNLLWQKAVGGSNDDTPQTLQIISTGQYIVAGKSNSADGDLTENHGGDDMWIVKLNSACNNVFYQDADGDGYGNLDSVVNACSTPSGYVADNSDCNDNDSAIHPGAPDICNGIDDNCDGNIDENGTLTFYLDADGDGYGNLNSTVNGCSAPSGYVADNTDCNDANADIHPGASDICNSIDDNCDGNIDENVTLTFYLDADGDGYGNLNSMVNGCSVPSGYVTDHTDCNDNNSTIHPGASEICNSIDDNCDGNIDENGTLTTFYLDADGDEYGNLNSNVTACIAPAGYVTDNTDCNDGNATIHPGMVDICNSIDDNCDGNIDENAIIATVTPSGNVTLCQGTSITLTANTGSGITYQWKKAGKNIAGETNSTYIARKAASYTVSESNSFGCSSASANITVTIIPMPAATITYTTLDLCGQTSLTLTANSGTGLTYQWKKGQSSITGATNQTYSVTAVSTYKVVVTNSNGCSKISAGAKVTKSCKENSASSLPGGAQLDIYPNPNDGHFTVNLYTGDDSNSTATLEVFNEIGQRVYRQVATVNEGVVFEEVQLPGNTTPGIYFVKVALNDQVYTGQIHYQK